MTNHESQHEPTSTPLTPQEAQTLDALIASASRPPHVAGDDRSDLTVASLLRLIDQCPAADPPADLTARTLERVAEVRRKRWFAHQFQALASPRVGMGWNELGAVAAMVLIGVSLLWPMLGRVRSDARRVACATNLQTAGAALAGYAADNQGVLPRRGTWPGSVWWNVGKEVRQGEPIQSNSANLYALVRAGYINPQALNCPENQQIVRVMTRQMQDWPNAAAVSYSYQNQYSPEPSRIDRIPKTALLADKNPLFAGNGGLEGLRYQAQLSPQSPSLFHGGKGQNILFAHGAVQWSSRPVLTNGDNIWLANGVDHYNGTEAPADAFDTFLVP